MFEEEYQKEMDRLRPDPRQMERLYAALEKGEPTVKKGRKQLRTALAAVGCAALLCVAAVAASPSIREALTGALGDFAPYAQAQEGTAVDQGIQVKVVSALADSYTMQVYAEVRDLTGDRLSKAEFGGIVEMELDGELGGVFSVKTLCYDAETKTALLRYSNWRGAEISDGQPATLKLARIQPDYHRFRSQAIPLDLLTGRELASERLADGTVVPVPGQTNYALEGDEADGVVISSLGFAADGKLHILFRFPEGTIDGKQYALCAPVWTEVRAAAEGRELTPLGAGDIRFERDGAVYYDNVVEVTAADLPDIAALSYAQGLFTTQESIEGNWEVPVTFTKVEEQVSPLSGELDGNALRELRLSPMSVVVARTAGDEGDYEALTHDYTMTVFLSDGTSVQPRRDHIGFGADLSVLLMRWAFDEPVRVEDITAVDINGFRFPVENGMVGAS